MSSTTSKEDGWKNYLTEKNLNGTFSQTELECIKHAYFSAWEARSEYREREAVRLKDAIAGYDQWTDQTDLLRPEYFVTPEDIYRAYPRKVGKADALKAIGKALKGVSPFDLLSKVQAYAEAVKRWPVDDQRFIPFPATWINRGSYMDDPQEWVRNSGIPTGRIHSSAIKTRE